MSIFVFFSQVYLCLTAMADFFSRFKPVFLLETSNKIYLYYRYEHSLNTSLNVLCRVASQVHLSLFKGIFF